jgi:hypothetical protein
LRPQQNTRPSSRRLHLWKFPGSRQQFAMQMNLHNLPQFYTQHHHFSSHHSLWSNYIMKNANHYIFSKTIIFLSVEAVNWRKNGQNLMKIGPWFWCVRLLLIRWTTGTKERERAGAECGGLMI